MLILSATGIFFDCDKKRNKRNSFRQGLILDRLERFSPKNSWEKFDTSYKLECWQGNVRKDLGNVNYYKQLLTLSEVLIVQVHLDKQDGNV